jgi:GNAT superfamily N-acetyltransferase
MALALMLGGRRGHSARCGTVIAFARRALPARLLRCECPMTRTSTPPPSRSAHRPGIRIREVHEADDPALRQAYRLLTSAFEREERVAFSDWSGAVAERNAGLLTDVAWHLFIAAQQAEVVGLASGTYLGNVNIGMVGYLAITPPARAHGIGSRLRARLRREFERDALRIAGRPLEAVLGEVSLDNPWLRTLATRDGVVLLDFPYVQPSLYDGDEPSPFMLYYEPLSRPRTSLTASELRRLLYTVWRRVYRISRPLDRPDFRAMLRSLEGRRTIGRATLPRRPR